MTSQAALELNGVERRSGMTGTKYEVSDSRERFDPSVAWGFLSNDVDWGRWRTEETVLAQFTGAWRLVGAYERATSQMVGCARAVSDGFSIAYLADVYVSRDHRGHGLGAAMLQLMVEEGPGRNFKWMLHTYDAHGLYAKFGFETPDGTMLERPSPLSMPRTSSAAST